MLTASGPNRVMSRGINGDARGSGVNGFDHAGRLGPLIGGEGRVAN